MKLIFLGPPGAGKGTQALKVVEYLGIPQISTGDILRGAIREKTQTGLKAQAFIEKGELVPDEIILDIVRERLAQDDCKGGYLLDGFPRTLPQAEALDAFAQMDAVINLDVPSEVIVRRLSGRRSCPACGYTSHVDQVQDGICPKCSAEMIRRKDDAPETVQNRLDVYDKQTKPLIDYYQAKGLLKTVNSNGTIDEVDAAIREALKGL